MLLSRRIRLWLAVSSLSDIRSGCGAETVALQLKPLHGNEILCWPGTTDLRTLFDTFVKQYHLAPARQK